MCGRGTRQRGGGCALVGGGFPDGRWAVRNYLLRCALSLVIMVFIKRITMVWYAPHKQGARPMARHPLPPQFKNVECAQTTLPCS